MMNEPVDIGCLVMLAVLGFVYLFTGLILLRKVKDLEKDKRKLSDDLDRATKDYEQLIGFMKEKDDEAQIYKSRYEDLLSSVQYKESLLKLAKLRTELSLNKES